MMPDIDIEVLANRKRIDGLDDLPEEILVALEERLYDLMDEMEAAAYDNLTSRLGFVTGRLENALQLEVTGSGSQLSGRVFIEGVPYAKAQEEGAVIPPHLILPRGKILAFMAATGDKVFATRVFHPGGTIEGKHFMRDAYREVSPKVTNSLYYYAVRKLKALGYG